MRCKKPRRSARREGPNEQVFTYEVSCSRTRVASSLRNGVGVRTSGERDANRRHERQEQHRRASRRRAAAMRAGRRLGAAACGAAPCGARCERANGSVSAPSSHYPAQQPLLARRRGGAAASEPAALESVPPKATADRAAHHARRQAAIRSPKPRGDTLRVTHRASRPKARVGVRGEAAGARGGALRCCSAACQRLMVRGAAGRRHRAAPAWHWAAGPGARSLSREEGRSAERKQLNNTARAVCTYGLSWRRQRVTPGRASRAATRHARRRRVTAG